MVFFVLMPNKLNQETRKSGKESGDGGTRAVASQDNGADSAAPSTQLPNSRKVYVAGEQYVDLRVPFREISLAPTKSMSGEIEVNKPVRVYDTSGPWGDPDADVDVTRGLPSLRAKWIRDRGDVEEIDGRAVRPQDNGYLSEKHAAERNGQKSDVRFPELEIDSVQESCSR